MKVAINARLLRVPETRGWNRYTINLLTELPALGIKLYLYTDSPLHDFHLSRLPKNGYVVRTAPPMPYVLWEQHWLPSQCQRDRVDILHAPCNFGLPWSSQCPRILTLHDAIDHAYYGPTMSLKQRLGPDFVKSRLYHWIARSRAHHIITVSNHAKSDLERVLGIPSSKVTAIYEAADPRFHSLISSSERTRVRERYGLARPYVLYVGGWEQRKNIPFLLRAFAEANLNGTDLVLAGGQNEQRDNLSRLAQSLGITDRLRLYSWVDDDDLPALYAEALCFVYPSEYEGFGLQLCEAMSIGCPTLAARSSSLPEVLGNGGETFPLDDTRSLAALLGRVISRPHYAAVLKDMAIRRSAEFSWRHAAEQTVAVYARCRNAPLPKTVGER